MKIERIKPYKSCDPHSTIENIRRILKKCGIFTIEQHFHVPETSLYSCSVIIANNELYDFCIQTNGKGSSFEYALASAYGEFMERLQNNRLFKDKGIVRFASRAFLENNHNYVEFKEFLENDDLMLDFICAPDERLLNYNKLTLEQQKLFSQLVPGINNQQQERLNLAEKAFSPWVPFYNINKRTVVDLPIDLININCTSNGMCAGNTYEEAIIQGICEIFERYAIKEIFKKQLTPPTIPIDYFEDTLIFNRLIELKYKFNIDFIIKDCSLGIGLPVIGLILIDKNSNKYFFNLGSDVSPITALERCLNEAYQGTTKHTHVKFQRIDFSLECQDFNLDRIIRDSTGCWPTSIFGTTNSYTFSGFDYPIAVNDKKDLKYLLNKIEQLNFEIFIRDVSFLGFPAFYIYMPNISNIDYTYNHKVEMFDNLHFDRIIDYFQIPTSLHIKESNSEEIRQLLLKLDRIDSYGKFALFPYNVNEDNRIDENVLLAMLNYKLSNYKCASSYISAYIDSLPPNIIMESFYFYCVRDFIHLRSEGRSKIEISNILCNVYNPELLDEVCKDLEDENNVLVYAKFPNCFNCKQCEIRHDCRFKAVLTIRRKIQKLYSKNVIKQSHFASYFNNL